jgi:hypothetical protein
LEFGRLQAAKVFVPGLFLRNFVILFASLWIF